MSGSRRAIRSIALTAVPGIFIVGSTLLPWATYENRRIGTTTDYGAGSVGYLLSALTIASVLCAVGGDWYRAAFLRGLAIAYGIACVVCSIVLSVARLIEANNAANSHLGGSQTSRAAGAVIGILASAALLIICCVLPRIDARDSRRVGERFVPTVSPPFERSDSDVRGDRAVAILCYAAGSIFAALLLLILVTKLTGGLSDVRADLVMAALGFAAFACYRAGHRLRRLPASSTHAP